MHEKDLSPEGGTAADRHVAVEYSSDDEWACHLLAFVEAGLVRDEQVQYFADSTDPARVLRTLTERGVDAASAVRRGQLVVATADETYLTGARFDPDAMVGLWHEAVDAAAAQGFNGLRAIGEMSWGGRGIVGAERLLEYELRIHHEVFEQIPLRAWCFYDRRLLPRTTLDVLREAHLSRAAADPGETPVLTAAPLEARPGFRLAGSAGYESRDVVVSAAAALSASPAESLTLDLSALDHADIATLADIVSAARRRPAVAPVRLLGAPATVHRMLQLFPELRAGLEVAES
ncbi:MEDS domain-containing protein [Streptomyces sp. NPDC057837]|uniref:MEDS domain-containing protein n=1 Tax=Streptomyces sp. NPDC057837 TaxID=3346260 RepID=UPI003680525F